MKQCKSFRRYQGLRKPRCNCEACKTKFQATCQHPDIRETWDDEEIVYVCVRCDKIVGSEENTK